MPNWLVRLRGDKFDLETLPSLLRSPELTVIEENGSHYLKSSDFDSLGSADEVRKRAIAVIRMLNGAMKLRNDGFYDISEDGVTLVEEDGKCHHYVYLEGSLKVRSKTNANLTVATSNSSQQVAPQSDNVESWLGLAKNEEAVADALHFFGEGTWISLYKVYEIIRDDVGGKRAIAGNDWATKRSLNRFTQTAQSKASLGDNARHASDKYKPPARPMSIDEAKSLIRGVLMSWLRSKTH